MLVLLTRPRAQGNTTARRIVERGHEAVVAPVTTVVPTGEPAPAGPFDAVILTSANALPALLPMRDRLAGAPLLTVGARTAEAARAAGFDGVAEARGDARALADLVAALLPEGGRLLHAAGRDRKAEPARSLASLGYDVATWTCYEARAADALPAEAVEALRTGQAGAVLHYSRRSAELFLGLCRLAGLDSQISGPVHLCLSADVAEGLRGSADLPVRIAAAADEDALLHLLDDAAGRAGSRPPQSG